VAYLDQGPWFCLCFLIVCKANLIIINFQQTSLTFLRSNHSLAGIFQLWRGHQQAICKQLPISFDNELQ
jgi:hypothetical protein